MLRGMLVIVTAFMSIIFLKAKLYRHHWTSAFVIFLGLSLVEEAVLTGSNTGGITTKPLGIILLVAGTFFTSAMFIVEEKILG